MKKRAFSNIVLLLAITASAQAMTHLVPDDYPTIQSAINAAVNGDTVVVADGVYTGDGNRDIDFLGKAITVKSENGPENCVIDCNGTETEPHRAFCLDTNSKIIGFTIIKGDAEEGGAIYCEHESPMVINCVLRNNSAQREGGAIYCCNSNPTIINCVISDNLSKGSNWMFGGGGIYASSSNINVINSKINKNSASYGGGINCQQYSNLTVEACIINDNLAEAEGGWGKDSGYGGGICCCEGSSLNIIDSTICNNIAKGGDSGGGGISFNGHLETKLIIADCIISDNLVEGGWNSRGGGIFCGMEYRDVSTLLIVDCTINNNAAKISKDRDRSYGGGIYFYQSNPIISNCKINDNQANEGGGISCEQGSAIITGCIISGNFPFSRYEFGGGGIYCRGSSPSISNCTIVGNSFYGIHCENGYATITNSILYYNGDGRKDFDQIHNGAADVTYSDIQTHEPEPWPGIGNINADPCFTDPGYWDINSVWVKGDYHLLPNSLCIDAGNLTSYLLDSTDLDGNPRVTGQIDMGAYEFLDTASIAGDINGDNIVNFEDFAIMAYHWLEDKR